MAASKNPYAAMPSEGSDSTTAMETPLLPEHAGQAGGSASVLGAVFNVSTSVVGAGIMSIPAAMRVLGVAPAAALIAGVAAMADAAVGFMLRYTRGGGAPSYSYAALMGDAFGRAGAALLNVFVAANGFGTLTVYLIVVADVVSGAAAGGDAHAGVLQEWFGSHWWTGREVVLVAAAAILLPLIH
nr:unnamed protein product [Digitaria exilis]